MCSFVEYNSVDPECNIMQVVPPGVYISIQTKFNLLAVAKAQTISQSLPEYPQLSVELH